MDVAGFTMHLRPSQEVQRLARGMLMLFLTQMGLGLLNLGLLAPIWMQLIHLLVADLVWITLVLFANERLRQAG